MLNDTEPHRRASDCSPALRITGYRDMRALVTNVLGGLAIAAIVGGLTAWRTQAVMAEQLAALVERFDASQAYQLKRIDALQEEILQIRRDFYPPRFGREARTSERGP